MFAYLCLPGLVTPALCNVCKSSMHDMLTQLCQRFSCMMLLTQGQKDHLKLHLSQNLSLLTFPNLGVSMQKICCGLPSGLASTLVRSRLHNLYSS